MKVIDLLNKIEIEEAPETIRIEGFNFIFNSYVGINRYYVEESTNNYWFDFMTIDLEDNVEIITDDGEFIDIENITELKGDYANDELFAVTLNKLMNNQKKIIQALKENK